MTTMDMLLVIAWPNMLSLNNQFMKCNFQIRFIIRTDCEVLEQSLARK